jgi:hypothetical protein
MPVSAIARAIAERYREAMPDPYTSPAERLTQLLETLPPAERMEITAWLLLRGDTALTHTIPAMPATRRTSPFHRELASSLPVGEESQLVTIRLPAERHAELRAWCNEHNFTMAAVVRGLVERFLEQQQQQPG